MSSSSLTARVSATLRQAGLPVLRYADRIGLRGRSGIRVGNYSAVTKTCHVFFHIYFEDSSVADEETERELSDQARAVLMAKGFHVDAPMAGITHLTVKYAPRDSSSSVEDVHAVAAASGLDISQPTPNEWHVEVDGKRGAYSIRRTGKDARTRYAVHGRGYGAEVARNLRSMGAAIEAVKLELEAEGKS